MYLKSLIDLAQSANDPIISKLINDTAIGITPPGMEIDEEEEFIEYEGTIYSIFSDGDCILDIFRKIASSMDLYASGYQTPIAVKTPTTIGSPGKDLTQLTPYNDDIEIIDLETSPIPRSWIDLSLDEKYDQIRRFVTQIKRTVQMGDMEAKQFRDNLTRLVQFGIISHRSIHFNGTSIDKIDGLTWVPSERRFVFVNCEQSRPLPPKTAKKTVRGEKSVDTKKLWGSLVKEINTRSI